MSWFHIELPSLHVDDRPIKIPIRYKEWLDESFKFDAAVLQQSHQCRPVLVKVLFFFFEA